MVFGRSDVAVGAAARLEEAHAKAEAEKAALEQLKEENPEAYATPEPEEPAEGEAGESTTPEEA